MRYVTISVDCSPKERRQQSGTAAEATVSRECIYQYNQLTDGTIVMLTQLRGDLDRARERLETRPNVLEFDVPERGDGIAYIRCVLTEPVRSILSIVDESEVVVETPLEFADDGSIRVTVIGDQKALQRVLAAVSERVETDVERTGEYHTESRHLGSLLTDRQREILATAVEQGYYEVPRRTTYEDIAESTDLSVATVGEHLQKIEATILSRVSR